MYYLVLVSDSPTQMRERLALAPSDARVAVGRNTRDEADQFLDRHADATAVYLVTSGYHGARALMTWVKAANDRGRRIHFGILTSNTADDDTARTLGELRRIRDYQAKGDCATLEEALEYLA